MSNEPIILSARATLEPVDRSYEELLALAQERAPDPDALTRYTPVFWRAQVSNNRLDFYATSMAETSLDNYVEDLTAGISFQDSHDWQKLGIGQSILGERVDGDEVVEIVDQELMTVHGTFFTLRGMEFAGHNTDNFIAAIETGLWRDVSIGFYARDITCSICGKQSFSWWSDDPCWHLPGVEYENEETGDIELAWGSVNDGRLMETSQVYSGATPGAEINHVVAKAEAMAEERSLSPREVATVERRYQVRLAMPAKVHALGYDSNVRFGSGTATSTTRLRADGSVETGKAEGMAGRAKQGRGADDELELEDQVRAEDEENEEEPEEELEQDDEQDDEELSDETTIDLGDEDDEDDEDDGSEDDDEDDDSEDAERSVQDVLAGERARLAEHGVKLGKDPIAAVRALGDAIVELKRRNAGLAADAKLGKEYRKRVIDETLREGIRAKGDKFRKDEYAAMLRGLDLEQIEILRDDLRAEADERLKRNTRIVTEGERPDGDEDGDELAARRRPKGAHRA